MGNFRTDLCIMLRSARRAQHLSQQQVADRLGVSRSAYTYYETGKTLPDLLTARTLSQLYGLPPEAFLYPENFVESGDVPRRRATKK